MDSPTILLLLVTAIASAAAAPAKDERPVTHNACLYRKVAVPKEFLITRKGVTFGGDVRVGDLTGDGRCDFLVYRCNHGAPKGGHMGGMKPCFLGAFNIDGEPLWRQGEGGNHPSRPMSVAVHDFDGDGAAEVLCFWHRPAPKTGADSQSLADVVVQIRRGNTGDVIREAAPRAITARRRRDPVGANWVHQRLLIANFRGLERPRDFVVKLGDTYVAMDDELNVLWTYRSKWVKYANCPAYIPSVGDIDGDGRDEVNTGYALLDSDGSVLWEKKLATNMDSVVISKWDSGHTRAICSGGGHVMDAQGNAVLKLGEKLVPHGQEVRVADFHRGYPGPEMALRWNGHRTDIYVVSSAAGEVVSKLKINFSPTNVGMEAVHWNGPDKPALLYNGGWLWDLETGKGAALPGLPPPRGNKVHRMSFYHVIAADVCGDEREELVLWDPAAAHVYVYTADPLDEAAHSGYRPGPKQYNPRLMD